MTNGFDAETALERTGEDTFDGQVIPSCGTFIEDGELWSHTAILIAQSRQLTLMPLA